MQAVAALRGGFGGHQVMAVAEGETLRRRRGAQARQGGRGKVAPKEKPTKSAAKAAAKGRKAASAGPSSGTGSTSAPAGASAQEGHPGGSTRQRHRVDHVLPSHGAMTTPAST